jgi:hypothetical protein
MSVPKKYLHDRTILLLLSVNTFLAVLSSLLILLRLDPGRGTGYIVQYRSNLGLNEFKSGPSSVLLSFIVFSMLVLVFHVFLSARVYHIRRHFSVVVLGMGLLLLTLSLIVSNALLIL